MLTMNCLIEKKYPIDKPLTVELIQELLKENRNANYSYLCLLKEYIYTNSNITVRELLQGYSGIKLFTV